MSSVWMQPGNARSNDFQIQLPPSPNPYTSAKQLTPSRRNAGAQARRNTFDFPIMAHDKATVGAGKRSSSHWSGVAGSPDSRLEITAIFRSFHPSSRVFTLPASTATSTLPLASRNIADDTSSFG